MRYVRNIHFASMLRAKNRDTFLSDAVSKLATRLARCWLETHSSAIRTPTGSTPFRRPRAAAIGGSAFTIPR